MGSVLPEEILFVFGPARGGTTFLTDILYEAFDYSMGPEGTFIGPFIRRAGRYGDLGETARLDRLLSDLSKVDMLEIMRSRWPVGKRIDVAAKDLKNRLPERSIAGALFAVLACVRDARGKQHIGTKNPDFCRHLDLLEDTFGQRARFLCIMRDGRDVALSNYGVSWGQRNPWACARTWCEMAGAIGRFRQRVGPDRLLVIRYEDILADAEGILGCIERFLGKSLRADVRKRLLAELEGSNLRNNSGKWKKSMSEDDVRIYEAVAGDALRDYGYEIVNPDARARTREVVASWAGEFCRRAGLTLRQATSRVSRVR